MSTRMPHLTNLYEQRLSALGFSDYKMHTTRLHEMISKRLPQIRSLKIGTQWILLWDEEISYRVKKDMNNDEKATVLDASKILRNECRRETAVSDKVFEYIFADVAIWFKR